MARLEVAVEGSDQRQDSTWRSRLLVETCHPDAASGSAAPRWLSPVRLLLLAGILGVAAGSEAQVPGVRPSPYMLGGPVVDAVVSDSTVYVAGTFDGASPRAAYTGGFVVVDPVTAAIRFRAAQEPAWVRSVASDGADGFFVSGQFYDEGEGVAQGIVHVLSDGSRDPNFGLVVQLGMPPVMTYAAGRLYVSKNRSEEGNVFSAEGTLRAIDVSNGQVLAFNPYPYACFPHYDSDINRHVSSLTVVGSRLIVSGQFGQMPGFPCSGSETEFSLAAIDVNTGAVLSRVDSSPMVIRGAENGQLYFVDSTQYGRIDANTLAVTSVAALPQGNTLYGGRTLAHVLGQTLIAGKFDGADQVEIRAYDSIGRRTPWRPSVVPTRVSSLAVMGNTVYALGSFTDQNGNSRSAAAFDFGAGGALVNWNPRVNGLANPTPGVNGLAIGGEFSGTSAQYRNGLAAFDATSGTLLPWHPTLPPCDSRRPWPLAMSGREIVAHWCGGIRMIDASSGSDRGLSVPWSLPGSDIYAMAADQATVYVAGSFIRQGGRQQLVLALDSASGAERWTVPATGMTSKTKLVLGAGELYVSTFESMATAQASGRPLARLNALTGSLMAASFPFHSRYDVEDIQVLGGALYVAGYYYNYPGVGLGVARVLPSGDALIEMVPAPLSDLPVLSNRFRGHLSTRPVAAPDAARAVFIGGWRHPPRPFRTDESLSVSPLSRPWASTVWSPDGRVKLVRGTHGVVVVFGEFARVSGVLTGNMAMIDAPPETAGVLPTAVNDVFSTAFQTALTVAAPGVLANDRDNGGGTISAELVSGPPSGTVNLSAAGGFTLNPPIGFAGMLSFSYRARTAAGVSAPATVTVVVAAAGIPVAVADAYITSQGVPLTLTAPGVLSNDDSPGGLSLTAVLDSQASHGTVTLSPNGSFVYAPQPSFVGMDLFTYRVSNSIGLGNVANVTIHVTGAPGPHPPTAVRVAGVVGNSVMLRWQAPPGPVPTGYLLEGGVVPGRPLVAITTGSANPLFIFTAPTGSYFLRVRALDGAGPGPASVEIPLYVGAVVAPSAPTALLGLVNGSSLALSWQDSYSGGTPDSHILDVTGAVVLSLPLGAGETLQFSGVPAGTYTFAVRTVNAAGLSAPSSPVTMTFPGACGGPPQPPQNFLAQKVGGTLNIAWDQAVNGPAATGYVLNVSGSASALIPLTGRSLSVAAPAGTFALSVSATNACGVSAATASRTVQFP